MDLSLFLSRDYLRQYDIKLCAFIPCTNAFILGIRMYHFNVC